MSGLEIDIENDVVDLVYFEYGVVSLKLNVSGNTGWPDRIFFISGGRPLFIEFKRPGEVPRPKQIYIHKVLKARGYNVQVHTSKKEAAAAIKAEVDAATLHEKSDEIFNRASKRGVVSRPRTKKN